MCQCCMSPTSIVLFVSILQGKDLAKNNATIPAYRNFHHTVRSCMQRPTSSFRMHVDASWCCDCCDAAIRDFGGFESNQRQRDWARSPDEVFTGTVLIVNELGSPRGSFNVLFQDLISWTDARACILLKYCACSDLLQFSWITLFGATIQRYDSM